MTLCATSNNSVVVRLVVLHGSPLFFDLRKESRPRCPVITTFLPHCLNGMLAKSVTCQCHIVEGTLICTLWWKRFYSQRLNDLRVVTLPPWSLRVQCLDSTFPAGSIVPPACLFYQGSIDEYSVPLFVVFGSLRFPSFAVLHRCILASLHPCILAAANIDCPLAFFTHSLWWWQ